MFDAFTVFCGYCVASGTYTGAGKTGERAYDAPGLQRTLLGAGLILVYSLFESKGVLGQIYSLGVSDEFLSAKFVVVVLMLLTSGGNF